MTATTTPTTHRDVQRATDVAYEATNPLHVALDALTAALNAYPYRLPGEVAAVARAQQLLRDIDAILAEEVGL